MKSKYMNDLANALAGHAQTISHQDKPEGFKALLQEASHCLDTRNVWIEKGMVKNARGGKRKLTVTERVLHRLFGIAPNKVRKCG